MITIYAQPARKWNQQRGSVLSSRDNQSWYWHQRTQVSVALQCINDPMKLELDL